MKYRHNITQDRPIVNATDDTSNALIHMRTPAQPVCTAADSPTANSGRGAVNARRSIRGGWCSMAVLVAFAAMMLAVSSTPAWAAAPTISNLNDVAIAEQIETVIDSDVSISNPDGTGFGSGYIEFSLTNSGSNDDLNIRSSSSPNSEGEISVSGSDVYIGTGSDKTKIGTIDATHNGQDGQKLQINFVSETASLPTNNNFETGTTTGWTIDKSIVSISPTAELIAALTNNADFSNTGDTGVSQNAVIDTDASQGTYSLKIYNSGTTASGYGNIWGPSAMSSSFSADAGSKILFDWKATKTSDYYIAYALLIDNQHGTTTVLFADEGVTSVWQTQEVLVSTTSNNLQFKFILGSYDNTGGRAVGASMHIDNIRALSLADSVVTSLSRAVTYIYTDDSPSGSVVSGRTLTINTQDKDSESASSTATISVYGDSPSFNSGSSFSVDENETSLTKVLYDTQVDNGDGGSNDQDITYSFIGGDGQNLFDIDSDDGEVRLNSIGVSTLDYETTTSYTLQIRADDGQAIDNTADLTVTVNVNDANEAPYAPTSLQCEGQTNPTEVSDFTPEFGWTFSDQNIGNTQSAYQILVAASSANLTSDNGDRWDSGKVTSSSSSNISYVGSSLAPCTTHHWKVKTWDNHGAEGSYCAGQTFVMVSFAAPNITSSAPESPVNDTYYTWAKFNVSIDQSVNVTWYLNEVSQHTNESVTEASYTFHAEYISEHNVSAVAENANGTDMRTWAWNVAPGAIDHFTVTGITDPVVAGVPTSPVVTAYDAYDNVKTDYTGTINFTSTDGSATLPADYTFKETDSGTKTFSNGVTLKTVGEWSVTVTGDTKTGSQTGITVTPAAIDYFNVTGMTDPVAVWGTTSPVVTAYDAYDNVKTDYTGTIHFTSTDGSATLPADYTFKETDSGTKTFTNGVTLKTVGEWSVTVTGDTKTGSQTGITVTPAAIDYFNVTGMTDPVVAGVLTSPVVTAYDAYDNVKTDYTGTINFTSTDGSATLPADYTFNETDGGTKTFANGVTLKAVGERSVTVTGDTKTGSQTGITVTPAAIDYFNVTGITDPVVAGVPTSPVVTAYDAYDNVKTDYTGTINFTSTDGSATLPADYTFEETDGGTKTFANGTTLKTVGERSVTVTGDTKTGSQTGITVTMAAMDHFNVAGITDPVAVWETTSPTVTACDAYNNVETDYVGTINFTSTDGNATLPGNYKFEEADSGTKTFTNEVILKTVGEQNVTVTDADYKTGSQTGITATHAAIDHLIVAGITDPITSTTTSGVNVTAKDEYGNTVLNYAGTIHFTTTDYSSDALLPDDYMFKPADDGAKAFDGATAGQVVKLVTISEQTVTATDTVKFAVTGSQTVTVQTNAVTSYDINLVPGWNLISTPLIPDNSSIETVLSGMTRVKAVYTYDALTATWMQYTLGATQYATLTHITAEKGYWFMMNASETLTINGSFLGPGGATPPEYPAYIGWNLIGFHSLSADIPYDYLSNVRGHYASEMYGYENGLWITVSDTNVVNGTDNLEPGYGYWLYMEQNGTITP